MRSAVIAVLPALVACSSLDESDVIGPQWAAIGGVNRPVFQLVFRTNAAPILMTFDYEVYEVDDLQLVPFATPPPNVANGGWLWAAADDTLWWTGREFTENWRLPPSATVWERVDHDPLATRCGGIRSAKNGTLYAGCEYPDLDGYPEQFYTFQRPGEAWNRGRRVVGFPALTAEMSIDPSGDGVLAGFDSSDALLYARLFEADGQPLLPESARLVYGSPMAVTPAGHMIVGDYGYGAGRLWELRPDGTGRSWVDEGCVDPLGLTIYCRDNQLELLFGSEPVLAPTGVVYEIRRVQD